MTLRSGNENRPAPPCSDGLSFLVLLAGLPFSGTGANPVLAKVNGRRIRQSDPRWRRRTLTQLAQMDRGPEDSGPGRS